MSKYKYKIILSFLLLAFNINAEETDIEYLVPTGFSTAEYDNSMQLLGVFNGNPLPGAFYFSEELQRLTFNKPFYRNNGVDESTIILLENIFSEFPYTQCKDGCDYVLSGHLIRLDKINQVINITNNKSSNLMPTTTWGLVHNQSIDLAVAANNYRMLSVNGQGYIGLPMQSFGYINWFHNSTRQKNHFLTRQRVGIWYLQKNFPQAYLRTGQKNNLDSQASRIHTMINPWLDQFITLGSHSYLMQNKPSANALTLYAPRSGDYELYREGNLIRRIPAQIGRNSINYNQLPSGYYQLDIRLIDSIGSEISRENVAISNVDYQNNQGWFVTAGRGQNEANLLQLGGSQHNRYFQYNVTLLGDTDHQWIAETNISRPMRFKNIQINPTLGLVSSRNSAGSYGRLRAGNHALGYLTLSYYQLPSIPTYLSDRKNSILSYHRNFGAFQLSYRFDHTNRTVEQSIKASWQWTQPIFNTLFTLAAKRRGDNYSIFLNTAIAFNQINLNIDNTYSDKQLTMSAQYKQQRVDDYGATIFGVDSDITGKNYHFSSDIQRLGSRGNSWLRVGIHDQVINSRLHYDGMLAANSGGIALGSSHHSGVAMLVKTPNLADTPYSFNVEGFPVAHGGTYAVPVSRYQDRRFAHTDWRRSDVDMALKLPADIVRGHPGQVFSVTADVKLNLLYNGFFVDAHHQPISGIIDETGDVIHPNGLFSMNAHRMLKYISIHNQSARYSCDMRQHHNYYYFCRPDLPTLNHQEKL
ncbi:TcfC E-set like domain-containing protein [Candidatus Regiella endosymbiont of Tuberolachnus salignus]|uniref:TcfC E-set like domain-containing protein n=1 Tax=Candidatus Regiella endosymbiont of Tuberolachnus salignus TaxID=3077956 RepID=UPI0030CFF4D8